MHLSASLLRLHGRADSDEDEDDGANQQIGLQLSDASGGGGAGGSASSTAPVASHTVYPHQVAGHAASADGVCFRSHRRRRSVVRSDDSSSASDATVDSLLKPIPVRKEKGRRERLFYEQVDTLRRGVRSAAASACVASTADDATVPSAAADAEWLSFLPRYYGTLCQSRGQEHLTPAKSHANGLLVDEADAVAHYLHLEDLTASYMRPCLLDVKIGTFSFDPFECAISSATVEQRAKIDRERLKCPSQVETGFRICGARIWRADPSAPDAGRYEVHDKMWARGISADQIDQPFWSFLGHRSPSRPTAMAMRPTDATKRTAVRVLPLFLARLRRLLHLCQTAPRWRFYASSMLFCYEVQPVLRAQLHLIDFGHAHPISRLPPGQDASHTLDDNYIAGVQSLVSIFERMLTRAIDTVGPSPAPSLLASAPLRARLSHSTRMPLRKLSTALQGPFVQRKSLSALLLHLTSRRLILSGRANSLLFSLSSDLPRVAAELRQAGLHRGARSTHRMQELLTRAFLGQLLENQRVASELDGTNTSFVRPAHSTDLLPSSGHPRTRRRAELLEQKRRDTEQRMRGLSLAASDAARLRDATA